MKTTTAILLLSGGLGFTKAQAQNLTGISSGGSFIQSSPFAAGASMIPPPYNTGRNPRLHDALAALFEAQQDLDTANPGIKKDYLPRSILGVQQAIADVEMAMDTADGRPTPVPSALPSLPAGVGNPASGLIIVPATTPKISSPNMEAALLALATAQDELTRATPGNKGIFLPRAMADVTFAMDNANAAINLVNGLPAVAPAPALAPASVAAPGMKNNQALWWAALAAFVVVVIGAELFLRKRQGV